MIGMTRSWLAFDAVLAVFSPGAALRRGAALMAVGKPGPALRAYARASRAGLGEAEYRIARCYLEATGVPRSRAEGARWLEKAARRGHVQAQVLLAMICLHGRVGEAVPGTNAATRLFNPPDMAKTDYVRAMHWARMAAKAGSGEAQAVLGFIFTSGPEDMRDRKEADFWYEQSAANGCPQGHLGHALALARQLGADAAGQHERAAAHLREAANADLPMALYLLGLITEQGQGVARDSAAAAQLYRRAAERGHRSAQMRWGMALMRGLDVKPDPCEGETWLRRAALAGDAEAAMCLGDLYGRGGALPPNHEEAATWLRRAAEAGHKGAARSLGALHLAGVGVARDCKEAIHWLRVSAAAGDGQACAELGNLLFDGVGDEEDRAHICRGFEQAAQSGDDLAAFNYAVCLTHGIGVGRDDKQAAIWLRRAAERVIPAQFWYGRALVDARGIEQDIVQGRLWIARAAEGGHVDAQVALGKMLLNGSGGCRDPQAALALFERAAGSGHIGAMFAAGVVHAGVVPADRGAVQHWLSAAAEHGHRAARTLLEDCLTKPAVQQRAAARPDGQRRESPTDRLRGAVAPANPRVAASAEGAMKFPNAPCACGSGLRTVRCCDLGAAYTAPAEAHSQIAAFAGRASQALATGDVAAAETLCLNALDVAPRLPGALWTLYQIRQHAGRLEAATVLLRRLVAVDPNNIDATQELAMLLFQHGDLSEAERHARNAVRLAPAHPRSHNLMGMILTEAERPHAGAFHYHRVLELTRARDPILLANLAWNLKCQGRIDRARQLYEESAKAAPNVFHTWLGWARLEEADRNFAAARSHLDRASSLRPDDPGVRMARAALWAREGNHVAALAELEPGHGAAATLGSDPNILLEKGRMLDRLGRYDEAFACFEAAKRRARELTGKGYFEREAREMADRLRHFFVSDRLRLLPSAPRRQGCAQPIFILGFPRSGTTLAEQALSCHPKISAADELPYINEFGETVPRLLGSPLAYPEALSELWMGDNRRGLELLRDAYLQKVDMLGIVETGTTWFTDKMPLNEMHLGLISLIFPSSPLIHILRHPLDVVLSTFSHHLTHGYFCAYSLESVARHYALVMDLVQHYRAQTTLRYLPVRYEDMVQDMADSMRRTLAFIGEPFDGRCVNFQDNRRLPHTPSYAQVSEKMYAGSRFRWRHYRKHLEPVISIVQPVMERLGYALE
jgi:TPR repeat protein/Flp pilus assembly protein TadD